MSVLGMEHSVTTDCFQESKVNWLLSSKQSWKATVASVPNADLQPVTCLMAGSKVQQPFQLIAHHQHFGLNGHWALAA
jgi:hypothetical protein